MTRSRSSGRLLANVAIVATLVLQIVAGFKLLAPPNVFPSLAPLRIAPAPALYPFLDYNMYIAAHRPGEALVERTLFGELADGRRVRLRARELGVSQIELRDRLFPAVRGRDPEAIERVAALFRAAAREIAGSEPELVALSWEVRRLLVGPPSPRPDGAPVEHGRVEVKRR